MNPQEHSAEQTPPTTSTVAIPTALAARYAELQPKMVALHTQASKLTSPKDLKACARKLGMLLPEPGGQQLDIASPLEMDMLQDYLLYMHPCRGILPIRQLANIKKAKATADETLLLTGMVQAHFSLFRIGDALADGWAEVEDLVRGGGGFALPGLRITNEAQGVPLLCGIRVFPLLDGMAHTGAIFVFGRLDGDIDLGPTINIPFSEEAERQLCEESILRWRALE